MTNKDQNQAISEDQFSHLLYHFDQSPEEFFSYLQYCCELDEDDYAFELMEYLIKDQASLDRFINDFYEGDMNSSGFWSAGLQMLNAA